jgi:hypothetical protein
MTMKSFFLGLIAGLLVAVMLVIGFRCREEVMEAAGKTWAALKPLFGKAWEAVSSLFSSLRAGATQVVGANPTTESAKPVTPIGDGSPQVAAAP